MTRNQDDNEKSRSDSRQDSTVFFQAHRGGLKEVPENTLETYLYSWELGGIPEADIRTTNDGIIISLHDATLARTTNCPDSMKNRDVSTLTIDEIKQWDAGQYFAPQFAGQKIPTLLEIFEEMKNQPARQLYLDLKQVDLDKLGRLIEEYGVGQQIIFAHNKQENLIRFSRIAPQVRTMLWIGGTPEEIKDKFEQSRLSGFEGLSQVQLHLYRAETDNNIQYLLDDSFLRYALEQTRKAGIDLEVLPFEFDDASLHHLLDLGIHWYATDYPQKFADSIRKWEKTVSSKQ